MRTMADVPAVLEARSEREPMSGCQIWTGSFVTQGYGQVRVDGQTKMAHRLAWEICNGPIPKGMCVCHRCDVRSCINVSHMFLGSQAENRRDCVTKRRHSFGVTHGMSKITEECVRRIRADARTNDAIGADYGLRHAQVSRIKN